jgi:hypothetical protein
VTIEQLIIKFRENVIAQNKCLLEGNSIKGNIAAKKYVVAFKKLVNEYGDKGRESLLQLINDDDIGVREMAAVFLLKYRTTEAVKVLEKIAKGNDIIAMGAKQALENWRDGAWQLDV